MGGKGEVREGHRAGLPHPAPPPCSLLKQLVVRESEHLLEKDRQCSTENQEAVLQPRVGAVGHMHRDEPDHGGQQQRNQPEKRPERDKGERTPEKYGGTHHGVACKVEVGRGPSSEPTERAREGTLQGRRWWPAGLGSRSRTLARAAISTAHFRLGPRPTRTSQEKGRKDLGDPGEWKPATGTVGGRTLHDHRLQLVSPNSGSGTRPFRSPGRLQSPWDPHSPRDQNDDAKRIPGHRDQEQRKGWAKGDESAAEKHCGPHGWTDAVEAGPGEEDGSGAGTAESARGGDATP